MNRIARMRPSPAMVVALIALFVSLGGVTWAALELPRNSITSKYLKDGKAVKNQDVVNDTLQGGKIAESTLGQVPSANTANSATTAGNATTATTASNADMLDDLNSSDFLRSNAKAADAELLDGSNSNAFLRLETLIRRESPTQSVPADGISGSSVNCNPGERAIAGGATWQTTPVTNATETTPVLESAPSSAALTGWAVTMGNQTGSSKNYNIFVICAS